MALRTSEEDTRLNPGQADADRKVSRDTARSLSEAEKESLGNIEDNFDKNAGSTDENSNIKKLQEKENGDAGWNNNFTGAAANSSGSRGLFQFTKGKGATAAVISLLFGAGVGFSALFSPGLLIVQMKEIMVDKFNTQLSSMDVRANKILNIKIDQTTKGLCSKITIKCKFSTMSAKQVANFKAAGIEVIPDKPTNGTRTKPTAYKYNGNEISASEFSKIAKSDPGFRSALKNAYNPKYAGFFGKAWRNAANTLGVTKSQPKPATSKEQRAENLNNDTKNGMKNNTVDPKQFENGNKCDKACAQKAADDANAKNQELSKDSAGRSNTGNNALAAVNEGLGEGSQAISHMGNFFKITGVADYSCQAYGAVQALGYAAKAIRSVQLARYAMAFIKTADMIKAGTASPEDVAFMGGILTEVTYDVSSTGQRIIRQGAATDSFGYKFAAYGDTSANKKSMTLAGQFLAGGGLTGELITMSDEITSYFGGKQAMRSTCNILGNPWVGAGSAIVGIAFMLIPGAGQAGQLGKTLAQAGVGVAVSVGLSIIPDLLKDIVAGVVTEDISGEASGNAITSGMGKMLSDTLAGFGGNAPMTKEDAIAYNSLQADTLAQYAEEERLALSPFDPNSRHTFMGSLVSRLLPSVVGVDSAGYSLGSLASVLTGSVSNLIPKSNALSSDQYAKSLDMCQDYDYEDMGIATDPFCNVIRGIPPQYLDKDPLAVIDSLGSQIDETTGEPVGNYAAFVSSCITNENPLGYTSNDFQESSGTDCVINDSNADYYLHYIDLRVEAGMSGEDVATSEEKSSTVVSSTIDMENLFEDSTSIACSTGTNEIRADTGYRSGKAIPIKLCGLPNTYEVDPTKNGRDGMANSRVSGAAYAMFEQMKKDLNLTRIALNDSFRTYAEQQNAKRKYLSQAAAPGYSNHQMGIAFDINMGRANGGNATSYRMNVNTSYPGNPVWEWLKKNAGTYGFKQLPSEAWHWSATGG